MHPRNLYNTPPDFKILAHDYPDLAPLYSYFIIISWVYLDVQASLLYFESQVTIDFQNESALRCLTQVLLKRDFGIDIFLPSNRLCPPLPNRLNYVLWIEDILNSLPSTPQSIHGVDIGTGASAIYPLLACSQNPNWDFIATEVDNYSLEVASNNIKSAQLQDKIKLIHVNDTNSILEPIFSSSSDNLDFTMCNPPFYGSEEEITQSSQDKQLRPNAVCTGAPNEMITHGGESAFVSRMIHSSINYKTRCRWFTSMLGKLSSLQTIVSVLRELEIDNYAVTEFIQGHTRRWAVAWSLGEERLPDDVARNVSNINLRTLLPAKNCLQRAFPRQFDIIQLENMLRSIPGISIDSSGTSFIVRAPTDTWSRKARRKMNPTTQLPSPISMACIVTLHAAPQAITLSCRWLQGHTYLLFETFFAHISQKLCVH